MRLRLTPLLLLLTIALTMIRTSEATAVITVSVSPAKVPGRIGKNIQFDIYISGIDERVVDLFAWELKVSWDDIGFNLVSVEEGPFLQQGGTTYWVEPSIETAEGKEIMSLACTLTGVVPGVRGEGVLATITLYVIAGFTGSIFDIFDIKLLNSQLETIWPEPIYDVILITEHGEFIRVPKSWDIEPPYGVVDIYDLGLVASNFMRNVTRPRKIATSWAVVGVEGWSNPQFVLASDELRAVTKTDGASTAWMYFGFNTTGWTGVYKVEVGLEVWNDAGRDDIILSLSNDNGTTWFTQNYTLIVDNVGYDAFKWIDVTNATSWTPNDINWIAVKLTYKAYGGAQNIRIDYLLVAVTPEPLLDPPEAFVPDADVNFDRIIDIDDLALTAYNFGSYPLEEE